MAQASNEHYHDIRDPYKRTNMERLLNAITRTPGITEITLAFHFTPGDFFFQEKGYPNSWSYRIPEVIRTALAQGLIRGVPTLHPDYTAYYPVPSNPEEVAA